MIFFTTLRSTKYEDLVRTECRNTGRICAAQGSSQISSATMQPSVLWHAGDVIPTNMGIQYQTKMGCKVGYIASKPKMVLSQNGDTPKLVIWMGQMGFNLWILGFSIFATTPDVQKDKSLQNGGMSGPRFLRKRRMLAGSFGPVAERHPGWFVPSGNQTWLVKPHENHKSWRFAGQIIELQWNIPYKWSMAWSMAL